MRSGIGLPRFGAVVRKSWAWADYENRENWVESRGIGWGVAAGAFLSASGSADTGGAVGRGSAKPRGGPRYGNSRRYQPDGPARKRSSTGAGGNSHPRSGV